MGVGRNDLRIAAQAAITLTASFGIAVGLSGPLFVYTTLGAVAVALATILSHFAPQRVIVTTLLALFLLGVVRRILQLTVGVRADTDPILLVGPTIALILIVHSLQSHSRAAMPEQARSPLDSVLLGISVAALLWSLNPFASSVWAGLASLLFFLAPTLWYWVGRYWLTPEVCRDVLKLVLYFGFATAAYMLYQAFVGFPAWDTAWIQSSGYAALNIGDRIRPFGLSTSAAESTVFVTMAVALAAVAPLGVRAPIRLLVAATGILAIFVGGARAPIVLTLVTILVVVSWRRSGRYVALVPLVLVVMLVPMRSTIVSIDVQQLDPGVQSATLRIQRGFEEPLDRRSSTLPVHLDMMRAGLLSAIEYPLGQGPSRVTLAGNRLGSESDRSLNTERDPSNLATALGLPGLMLYLALVVIAIRSYNRARRRRPDIKELTSAALVVPLATFGGWFIGGMYGATALVWLLLGWMESASRTSQPRDIAHTNEVVQQAAGSPERSGVEQPSRRPSRADNRTTAVARAETPEEHGSGGP